MAEKPSKWKVFTAGIIRENPVLRLVLGCCSALAITTTVSGAVLGVLIGFVLFPNIIVRAYGILYQIPYVATPFVWSIAVPSILVAVACIAITVWFTVRSYARELPARLMRPGTPPKGKKVWVEKIPFLWNALSFTGKVSARNIFRYKKRMLMTSIGIAGCTALILTGFGVKDSISGIIDNQYGEIQINDLNVTAHQLLHGSQCVGNGDLLRRLARLHLQYGDLIFIHAAVPLPVQWEVPPF